MKYEICYDDCDGEILEIDTAEELIEDVKNFIEEYSKSDYGSKYGCVRITLEKVY